MSRQIAEPQNFNFGELFQNVKFIVTSSQRPGLIGLPSHSYHKSPAPYKAASLSAVHAAEAEPAGAVGAWPLLTYGTGMLMHFRASVYKEALL